MTEKYKPEESQCVLDRKTKNDLNNVVNPKNLNDEEQIKIATKIIDAAIDTKNPKPQVILASLNYCRDNLKKADLMVIVNEKIGEMAENDDSDRLKPLIRFANDNSYKINPAPKNTANICTLIISSPKNMSLLNDDPNFLATHSTSTPKKKK